MNTREKAVEIFNAGVRSVLPSVLIPEKIRIEGDNLVISDTVLNLKNFDNIYVLGAGKATALMAAEIEKILGSRITGGHIIVKYGHSCRLKHISVTEAGHPVPDLNGFKSTGKILEIASLAGEKDLVLCLISGGGSALLADHPDGASPADMMKLNDLLVNCGASISEINAVRKHLSKIKGGQLARVVFPSTLVSIIISDVPGDNLDVIASGPTAPDSTTFGQAVEVLKKYNIDSSVPGTLMNYLVEGKGGIHPETPDEGDIAFSKTTNILLGTNSTALEAARIKALEYNYNAVIIDNRLQGDTASVAGYLVETALSFRCDYTEVKPVCLLFGGETTLRMTGTGKGGRNQHLALLCSVLLKDHQGITVLSGGTDGNDGPTDSAGAVVDAFTIETALAKKMVPEEFIAAFDSYHFFKKAGGHILTGPTMTNVMDIIIVIVS